MRTNLIVMAPPGFDDNLCLRPGPEPFQVQALIPEFPIETFARSVLPGLARIDQGCLNPLIDHPLQDGAGHELRTIVRPQMNRRAALRHEPCEGDVS